jgi:hypothetical protein
VKRGVETIDMQDNPLGRLSAPDRLAIVWLVELALLAVLRHPEPLGGAGRRARAPIAITAVRHSVAARARSELAQPRTIAQ